MGLKPRWIASQILLLVIVGWVSGLAAVHHLWLLPSIRSQADRQKGGVAIRWVEQCLNGLAQEREGLGRLCGELAASPQTDRLLGSVRATTQPEEFFDKLDPIGVLICDADQRVVATFGWVREVTPHQPKPAWQPGDRLEGEVIFPPAWQAARMTGLLSANGRTCLFARAPVGPGPRPRGHLIFVRPIDWPMLRDLSAVAAVNVTLSSLPSSDGPAQDDGLERVRHWSSGHGTMSAGVDLKDSLGRPVASLQVTGSVADIAGAAEQVREAYTVQVVWLIVAAFATFGIVYLLFIRPLAILVGRLSSGDLPLNRDRLSAGLFAETGFLARRFSDVMERIVVLSETDPLTGLLNRRQFQVLLEHEFLLSRRHNTPLAALMIDIDFFKQVNDRCGHRVGDEVLQMVARAVRRICRRSDICGRYGGEEFAAILPRTTSREAAVLAERIRDAVRAGSIVEEDPGPAGEGPDTAGSESDPAAPDRKSGPRAVTVSVGVAAVPESSCLRPDDLLDLADKALYAAKHSGRDRTVLASALDPQLPAAPDGPDPDGPLGATPPRPLPGAI